MSTGAVPGRWGALRKAALSCEQAVAVNVRQTELHETTERRLYFSGDTGFGPHFADIAKRFGSFDLAALDAGQYNARWADIHMNPEEASRAAEVLGARTLMTAHAGRFTLARHAWDEPFKRAAAASQGKRYRLLTPLIGEPVQLGEPGQQFSQWWEGLD